VVLVWWWIPISRRRFCCEDGPAAGLEWCIRKPYTCGGSY
jgi:hypothetical protein